MTSSYIGKVIDNYRILENLGVGGMGVVFKAINTKLDKLVALKMIAPGMAMNERFISRFQTEAKALAKIDNPYIVSIYDLRSHNDQWFIVMEYVDGGNLYDIINKEGAYTLPKAISIIKQVLFAIGKAHQAKIIHRDIKPQNIMLTEKGVVKITDFGLAKDQSSMINTMSIAGGGTLFYMPPEAIKGFSNTDRRSDIYSVGMTLYEMVTGNVPFENLNSDFDIRETIVRKEFKRPTEFDAKIPADFEAIIMKSIAKEADDRYQTAEEMLNAVINFEKQHPELTASKSEPQTRPSKPEIATQKPLNTTEQKIKKDSTYAPPPVSRKRSKFKIWLPIAAIIPVLFLVIFFTTDFFSAAPKNIPISNITALTISSSPEKALVYINNDSIGMTPLKDYSLAEGDYALSIVADNYQNIDTTISLAAGVSMNLDFLMHPVDVPVEPTVAEVEKPKKDVKKSVVYASLAVSSNPSAAEIWLNGQRKGRTQTTLRNLNPGNYRIKISKNGYEEYTEQIKLRANNNKSVKATLIPFTGGLVIQSDPASAQVKLNGKFISNKQTSLELDDIPVGGQKIEISKSGYASHYENVTVVRNKTITVNAKLKAMIGSLSIKVIPWGSIYINNKIQKASSDIKFEETLVADKYLIKVVHPTLGKWEKSVEIEPEKKTELSVNFNKKIPISVSAFDENGKPVSANIFVDNKDTGDMTPKEVKVNMGVHRLVVKKDGYIAVEGEKEFLVDSNTSK
ncbi:serine/threonine-protein kinase, partial [Calditrichota bacterium]